MEGHETQQKNDREPACAKIGKAVLTATFEKGIRKQQRDAQKDNSQFEIKGVHDMLIRECWYGTIGGSVVQRRTGHPKDELRIESCYHEGC